MLREKLRSHILRLGAKIERYPNQIVGTLGNKRVEVKHKDGIVETTIVGVLGAPIRGVIKPTSDGYIAQTLYLGPIPLGTIKYRIPYNSFLETIECILDTTLDLMLLAGELTVFVPFFVLVIALAIVALAPIIAFLICTMEG